MLAKAKGLNTKYKDLIILPTKVYLGTCEKVAENSPLSTAPPSRAPRRFNLSFRQALQASTSDSPFSAFTPSPPPHPRSPQAAYFGSSTL